MIIQCPSCSTKFAVDAAQLSDVENPRFHCSRCDHFFEVTGVSDKGVSDKTAAPSPTSPSVSIPSNSSSSFGISASSPEQTQLDLLGGNNLSESPLESRADVENDTLDEVEDIETFPSEDPEETVSTHEVDAVNIQDAPIETVSFDTELESTLSSTSSTGSFDSSPSGASSSTSGSSARERRLGVRHEFDLDDQPVVYASWPTTESGTAFEADLRHVHAKLVQGGEENEELPPPPSVTATPATKAPATKTQDLLTGPTGTSIGLPAANQPIFSPRAIRETGDGAVASLPVSSPPASGSTLTKPVEPSVLARRAAAAQMSARPLEELTPANLSYRGAVEEPEFIEEDFTNSDIVARPDEIWSDTRRAAGQELPVPSRRRSGRRRFRLPLPTNLSLPLAGSVPLLMMFCVGFWSTHLGATPQSLRSLFYLDPVGLPQLAPAGLEVNDLKSAFVTLDDGSRVLEIRGNIINASTRTFGKVKLEAKIFDEKNNELGRLIVDPHAGLADAKIHSLSSQSLAHLQEDNGNAFVRLNPSDRVPFRIVFTDVGSADAPANVQWFSTRIYSIEPLPS